ncbi:MAG: adenosine deaminase [Anaerolineae bacterium]
MDVAKFVQAMPKVELNVRLEGAFNLETLLTIAEENDIPTTMKKYRTFVDQLKRPDTHRLDDLLQTVLKWMSYPDDITRLVYDVGVYLHKQNVRYAEVNVTPLLSSLPGQTFEQYLEALNDGRSRVERGWGVKMAWVFTVPRNEPRYADETSRWTASTNARKNHVVGFGVIGPEKSQPSGQFERAFTTAHKKTVPTVIQAGDALGGEGVLDVLNHLAPSRIIDGWGTVDAPDVLDKLSQQEVPLVVSMARALSLNWTSSYATYPLRRLYDENVKVVLSADMPTFFHSTLNDEYVAAVEHGGLTLAELEEVALNAVRYSQLPEDEKDALITEFELTYQVLREEAQETPDEQVG